MSDNKRTASPLQSMELYSNIELYENPEQITDQPSNLYGFEIENNDPAVEVFLLIFNKLAADVTLGTTVPDMTFRVPAGANFGKDPQSFALKFCDIGLTVALTGARDGTGVADGSIHVWYWDKGN